MACLLLSLPSSWEAHCRAPREGREELNSSFGGSEQEAECCLAARHSEQPQKNAQGTEEHRGDDTETREGQ